MPKVSKHGPSETHLESIAKLSYRGWLWLQHHTDSEFAPLARFILSGGPEGVFVNKPLKSSQVAFQLKEMYVTGQGRPALTSQIIDLATKSVKAYRDDDRTVEDLMVVREAEDKAAETFIREIETSVLKDELDDAGRTPLMHRHGRDVVTGEAGIVRVMCAYTYKGGKTCGRVAVVGYDRCDLHGGMYLDPETVKGVLMRGQEKIVAASDAAIETVVDLMQNSTQDAIRLKAAEMMLDRAGYRPGMEITITGEGGDASQSPADLLRQRLDRLRPSETDDSGTVVITDAQDNGGGST